MLPPFDLPTFDLQGGAALAVARDAAVMGLLSCFGTAVFRVLVAPRAFAIMQAGATAAANRQLRVLARASAFATIAGLCAWLVLQAANMAGAASAAAAFDAIPAVLTKTSFGHTILLQLAVMLLLAAFMAARDTALRLRASLVLIAAALALQSGHSHAFSMQPGISLLLLCDVLHLFGAGAWLGGLVPLLMLVRAAPPKAAATAARWFSPVGQASLVALVASAMVQGWVLVASIPGLIGTAYGWMILVKLVLFGVLFGFAWFNRYRFAPALLRNDPVRARRVLIRSIALQTGFAVAIVLAAVILSELPPSMHVQAIWPFSQRFSLAAVREDDDFRREVLQAGLVLAAAMILVVLALIMRRLRVAAVAAAAIVAWFALPHLDLLFVPAYPTSFYHSPTGFTAASIVDGGALFARNCTACHGASGAGDGVLAKSLPVPPADLTAAHLWMHSDGELFWWISNGIVTPEGDRAMPGFADTRADGRLGDGTPGEGRLDEGRLGKGRPGDGTLDENARWALIDYIRAHNAGHAWHETATWPHAVKGADFGVTCGGRTLQLSDFQGRFVRLVFGAVPASMPAAAAKFPSASLPPSATLSLPPSDSSSTSSTAAESTSAMPRPVSPDPASLPDVVTILVAPPAGAAPEGACVARDETVPRAYAILAGMPTDAATPDAVPKGAAPPNAATSDAVPPNAATSDAAPSHAAPVNAAMDAQMEAVTGMQVLIDPDGWLRAIQPPPAPTGQASAGQSQAGQTQAGEAPAGQASAGPPRAGWDDPKALMAEIMQLRQQKVASTDTGGMPMDMSSMDMGAMKMAPMKMAPVKMAPAAKPATGMAPTKMPPMQMPPMATPPMGMTPAKTPQ